MKRIEVERLLLDPENPRLPEDVQGSDQKRIFEYFFKHGVLDELVDSFLDNGFFPHEPLIVLPAGAEAKHIVVEGNRRLAALFLVHEHPIVGDRRPTREPTEVERRRLETIECYEVATREDVRTFLGYRHISGLRPWRPEAKARYLTAEVERAIESGEERPFLAVARRVGSNVVGVRNAYVALALLRYAREECGTEVSYVLSERFGVWLRCMNSPEIRSYFGYEQASGLDEVTQAFSNIKCEQLKEVVRDLTPGEKSRRAVLADSRDVTQYGLVLANDAARGLLRRFDDLQIAKQVVEAASFPDRLAEVKNRIDALREEIAEVLPERPSDLLPAAESLLRSAKLLVGVISALPEEEES